MPRPRHVSFAMHIRLFFFSKLFFSLERKKNNKRHLHSFLQRFRFHFWHSIRFHLPDLLKCQIRLDGLTSIGDCFGWPPKTRKNALTHNMQLSAPFFWPFVENSQRMGGSEKTITTSPPWRRTWFTNVCGDSRIFILVQKLNHYKHCDAMEFNENTFATNTITVM